MLSITTIHSFDKYLVSASMCQVHVLNVGVVVVTHTPLQWALLNIILDNAIKLETELYRRR